MRPILQSAFALFTATSMLANAFNLSRGVDGNYSLEAKGESLDEILAAINASESVPLRFYTEPGRFITGTYRNMPLDQLLNRLGVSYVLTYEDHGNGYRLTDGAVLSSHATGRSPEVMAKIRKAVDNIRDDNIPWNASKAKNFLWSLGCTAVPELEQALYSTDYQARQVAAEVLRYCCPDYNPSHKLLEVTLELFRFMDPSVDISDFASVGGAFEYLRTATNVYPLFRSRLIDRLGSSDKQERLLSAMLLSEFGESSLAATAAPLLLPHLMDNNICGDGSMAAHALYRLGPPVRSYIAPLLESDDAQQADLARLILYQLDNPSATNARLSNFYFNTTIKNPVTETVWPYIWRWDAEDFPDESGMYSQREREPEIPHDENGEPMEPTPDVLFEYTLRAGETLEDVARNFAVLIEDIWSINRFPPGTVRIPSGSKIQIPLSSP